MKLKKYLLDVTLIAVGSTKISETIASLIRCHNQIDFKEIKLVSHEKPSDLPEFIKFEECPFLDSMTKYNGYIFSELEKHVTTSHCLIVQADSWIIRPNLWDDEWLQYDYIGAPWQLKSDAYWSDTNEQVRVGNGGFCLRSHLVMDLPKKLNLPLLAEQGWDSEDGNISCYHRSKFLNVGVKFAPVNVAAKFSFELPCNENFGIPSFGFHKRIQLCQGEKVEDFNIAP